MVEKDSTIGFQTLILEGRALHEPVDMFCHGHVPPWFISEELLQSQTAVLAANWFSYLIWALN